jgi:hypothetical protein
MRDLYSPHFSYRVCCKTQPPSHPEDVAEAFQLREVQTEMNKRLKEQGLKERAWEGEGGDWPLTFRYCRRASSSAFRIDVPYRVSSLKN